MKLSDAVNKRLCWKFPISIWHESEIAGKPLEEFGPSARSFLADRRWPKPPSLTDFRHAGGLQ